MGAFADGAVTEEEGVVGAAGDGVVVVRTELVVRTLWEYLARLREALVPFWLQPNPLNRRTRFEDLGFRFRILKLVWTNLAASS